jgi:hypothetical protein
MEASRMNQTSAQTIEEDLPGHLLQAARLRAGLSIQEVCTKLKMTAAQIESMESSRLDGLPPGGYGRAFVKGYARLLGLDPDDILKSLLAIAGNPSRFSAGPALQISPNVLAQRMAEQGLEAVPLETQDVGLTSEPTSLAVHQPLQSNMQSKWVKVSLAVLGFALIAYAIVPTLGERMKREEVSISEPSQELSGLSDAEQSAQLFSQPENQGQLEEASDHQQGHSAGVLSGFPPVQKPAQPVATVPTQPVISQSQTGFVVAPASGSSGSVSKVIETAAASAPVNQAAPVTSSSTAAPASSLKSSVVGTTSSSTGSVVVAGAVSSNQSATSAAVTNKVASQAAPPTQAPPVELSKTAPAVGAHAKAGHGSQVLNLQFTGRAYVTVRDRDGQMLWGQMGDAGLERRIEGHPPFRVTIGNAKVVQIRYKDQAYNFAHYVKDDVARFEIQ